MLYLPTRSHGAHPYPGIPPTPWFPEANLRISPYRPALLDTYNAPERPPHNAN